MAQNDNNTQEVIFTPAGSEAADGSVKRSWHRFSINKTISREEAFELQANLGYHPGGYGLDSFNSTDGLTTWECWHSCD